MSEELRLGMPKEEISLALGRLQELESVMGKFGLSLKELEKLMASDYHHFAARITGTNIVRVFTRHCVFSIDMASSRAAVAVSDTVWMHAIMQAKLMQDEAETKAREAQYDAQSLRSSLDDYRAANSTLQNELRCLRAVLSKKTKYLSRAMKAISGMRKRKKPSKSKRSK